MRYIWWLSQGEMEAIGPELGFPERLRSEWVSMYGRSGGGRLWGAVEGESVRAEYFKALPMGRWAAQCGGLVVEVRDLAMLRTLPGTVTDFGLERVSL